MANALDRFKPIAYACLLLAWVSLDVTAITATIILVLLFAVLMIAMDRGL